VAATLNGIGTRFQGTRWLPDGTYITTEWFVFFFVPLIPLRSVRVLEASAAWGGIGYTGQSLKIQPVPLDKGMVLRVYGWIVGGIAGVILLPRLAEWIDLPRLLY
jgi:hypothetical protein